MKQNFHRSASPDNMVQWLFFCPSQGSGLLHSQSLVLMGYHSIVSCQDLRPCQQQNQKWLLQNLQQVRPHTALLERLHRLSCSVASCIACLADRAMPLLMAVRIPTKFLQLPHSGVTAICVWSLSCPQKPATASASGAWQLCVSSSEEGERHGSCRPPSRRGPSPETCAPRARWGWL